ncbi:MAG: hypothetical protein ABF586_03820 [Sporolactobacillus sp.]
MTATIKLHNLRLAEWLKAFTSQLPSAVSKRAMAICASEHVWDYHEKSGLIGANVEDIQSTFYPVTVRWPAAGRWPEPQHKWTFSCPCAEHQSLCVHAAALICFRTIAYDRELFLKDFQTAPDAAWDSRFQADWANYVEQTSRLRPICLQTDPDKLVQRPDIDEQTKLYSQRIMTAFSQRHSIGS